VQGGKGDFRLEVRAEEEGGGGNALTLYGRVAHLEKEVCESLYFTSLSLSLSLYLSISLSLSLSLSPTSPPPLTF
jgi:hypothetical protein